VLSDLHLFARRSIGQELLSSVRSELEQADDIVLNGDTFDFRWSRFETEKHSIREAITWLEDLLGALRPEQRVHFIYGNHDCLTGFTTKLHKLAALSEDRLLPVEGILILGSSLFLHGDCANWKMNAEGFDVFRGKWSRDRQRGRLAAGLYDVVDLLGIGWAFHRLYFPREITIRRVQYHLDQVSAGWAQEVNSVYFGHTHLPFENEVREGVAFFNTGSGIRGMGFSPQTFMF